MTESEWTKIFDEALIKSGYSRTDQECSDMYVEIVKFMSNEILEYVIQRKHQWSRIWVTAVENELIERCFKE